MCPNMCNSHDYPWTDVKLSIALETKELTMLWMVGPKNREIAFKNGVYKWTDPKCTPKALGINGAHTARILQRILDVNREKGELVRPTFITNNDYQWQSRKP